MSLPHSSVFAADVEELCRTNNPGYLRINGGLPCLQAAVSIASGAGTGAILAALERVGMCNSSLNSWDSQGFAPLHLAAEVGSAECISILVSYRADVNAKTSDAAYQLGQLTKLYSEGGRTALHIAAEKVDRDVVARLLECNALVSEMNSFEMTARDLALEQLTLSSSSARGIRQDIAALVGATEADVALAEQATCAAVTRKRGQEGV